MNRKSHMRLQAALKRHLDEVAETAERVCREQRAKPLSQMATALISAFFAAKMRDAKASVALYSVSSDVDWAKMARQMAIRSHKAIAGMLATASEPLTKDPNWQLRWWRTPWPVSAGGFSSPALPPRF
jgi:Tetracyclin repressor-like, C-terminal domain